jgi:hypothetical protein
MTESEKTHQKGAKEARRILREAESEPEETQHESTSVPGITEGEELRPKRPDQLKTPRIPCSGNAR